MSGTTIRDVRDALERVDLECEALIAQRDTALARVESLKAAVRSFEEVANEAVAEAEKWRDTARQWKLASEEWRQMTLQLLREKHGNAPCAWTSQRTGDEGV